MGSCGCSSNNDDTIIDNNNSNAISKEQRREEKRRTDFLKNSVKDMNTLYESLGKPGRAMRIRPEEEYWIFSAKPEPEKNESRDT